MRRELGIHLRPGPLQLNAQPVRPVSIVKKVRNLNYVRRDRIAPLVVKLRRNVNPGLIKTRPVKVRAKNALPERIIRIRVVPA